MSPNLPEPPTKTAARIRCVLADSHTLVREGVRRLLEDDPEFEVVGEAAHAADALKLVLEHRPDLVVLDLGMPGMSSFDAGRIIHQRCAGTRVVYLTAHNGREYVLEGLRSGATGYLLKDISASGLRQALRDIHRGIRTLSPELVAKLAEDPESRPFAPRASSRTTLLTAREREVMKLLAEGHTARQISVLLGVSTKTVEAHRFNLMRKLGIHNKAQLVTAAIQKRIVTPPLPF